MLTLSDRDKNLSFAKMKTHSVKNICRKRARQIRPEPQAESETAYSIQSYHEQLSSYHKEQ